ncbi:hypothetical protein M422DRAFT_33590 [Sphaerobolus stellatus SS14]|uniref:Uncharacterized protein n=2 Tax=Sphaerobolus stellatus (strain SS14) TaxID=990650 RepID=A0A0C9VJR2_SPHS4|nr:hypothetical protein M422DRAFT_33590 [Sphaerobolus stellatus SS14]
MERTCLLTPLIFVYQRIDIRIVITRVSGTMQPSVYKRLSTFSLLSSVGHPLQQLEYITPNTLQLQPTRLLISMCHSLKKFYTNCSQNHFYWMDAKCGNGQLTGVWCPRVRQAHPHYDHPNSSLDTTTKIACSKCTEVKYFLGNQG